MFSIFNTNKCVILNNTQMYIFFKNYNFKKLIQKR